MVRRVEAVQKPCPDVLGAKELRFGDVHEERVAQVRPVLVIILIDSL